MFYDKFAKLCEIKGVSPTKAVEEMGLARTIATKWKNTGAVPRGKTIKIIAAYFGVSESYLLQDEESYADLEKEQVLAELQVMREDPDFRNLMYAYKKMTPEKVRIMKSFMKSLAEDDDNNAD